MPAATESGTIGDPLMRDLEEVFRQHSNLVFGTACEVTGKGEDGEDVVQTVFLRLLRNGLPREFQKNPKGYLYRAAVNESLNIIRSRRRHPTETLEEGKIHVISAATTSHEVIHRRLYEAIAELNPVSAGAVILRYVHNHSDADIAKLLGTSRVTIAVRLHMEPRTVKEELSWSRQAVEHTALLQQTSPGLIPSTSKLQFEVATLKPVARGDIEAGNFGPRPLEIRCKGVDEIWSSAGRAESVNLAVQGRCLGILFLGQLIGFAFDLPNERVSGTVPYEPYQLDAKAENPGTATKAELMEMLRNLVIDRLSLRTHTEFREEQGYALRLAESGLKIKETSLGEVGTTWDKRGTPGCDFYCWDGRFRFKKFAYSLGSMTGTKPIADLTNLKGVYEFRFTLNRVEDGPPASTNGPRGANGLGDPPKAQFDPPISKALEQQLGLRLDPGKVPIEYIVVDSMERPAEN